MDWALDHAPLSLCDADLRTIFRYAPGEATVIRHNASNPEPQVWVLGDEEWKEWILDVRSNSPRQGHSWSHHP
ncbi:hypothetical protein CGCVW01_v012842 [Colletotrichum viniferum]|nr:hypothetical protein CGCVW01_v012842 [Colletotrichum viniferum]